VVPITTTMNNEALELDLPNVPLESLDVSGSQIDTETFNE